MQQCKIYTQVNYVVIASVQYVYIHVHIYIVFLHPDETWIDRAIIINTKGALRKTERCAHEPCQQVNH